MATSFYVFLKLNIEITQFMLITCQNTCILNNHKKILNMLGKSKSDFFFPFLKELHKLLSESESELITGDTSKWTTIPQTCHY